MENVLHLDATGGRTARLERAGWRSKERLGKRIYQHPETGCWHSEEVALDMARRERDARQRERSRHVHQGG